MTDRGRVNDFAQSLLALKQRSGVSFDALARRMGISGSTLHRYCSGAAVPGDFRLVESMARLCGADPVRLKELHRLWILADAERTPSGTAAELDVVAETAAPSAEPAGAVDPAQGPRWRSAVTPMKAASAMVLIGAVGSGVVVSKHPIGGVAADPTHPVEQTAGSSQAAGCVRTPTTHVDGFHHGRVWESDFVCPNTPGATLVSMSDFRTPVAVMDSASSWLLCWQVRGERNGREQVWYYTRGDRVTRGGERWDGWGFMGADQGAESAAPRARHAGMLSSSV
jgi:hypothetical protein